MSGDMGTYRGFQSALAHLCGNVLNGPLTALCARLKRRRVSDPPGGGMQTGHMCRTEKPLRSPQSTLGPKAHLRKLRRLGAPPQSLPPDPAALPSKVPR